MQHMFHRGEFFYFLRRIPQELQPQFGFRRELRLSLGTSSRKTAKKLVKRYDLEMEKLLLAAQLQVPQEVISTYLASSPLFASKLPVTDMRFSACANRFLEEKHATIRPAGIATFRAVFREFLSALKEKPVQAYTHADMVHFREHLMNTGIKPTTVNTKQRYISVFFNWLVTHDHVKNNPCKGLTLRKTEPDYELRKVFAQEDIDRLFSSPAYMPDTCRDYQPQHFWVPLIGLLGLRINEICQLHTMDVRDVDGIWCLDINTDGGKLLKNLSSARLVPLPRFILDIGFVQYWQTRRASDTELLFPIRVLKANRPDYNFQSRKYIRKYVTQDPKKSFHSLRHTLATSLKNIGEQEAIISQILGHTNPSMTGGRYGKPYPPSVLLATLNKLNYKLDIARLTAVAPTYLK